MRLKTGDWRNNGDLAMHACVPWLHAARVSGPPRVPWHQGRAETGGEAHCLSRFSAVHSLVLQAVFPPPNSQVYVPFVDIKLTRDTKGSSSSNSRRKVWLVPLPGGMYCIFCKLLSSHLCIVTLVPSLLQVQHMGASYKVSVINNTFVLGEGKYFSVGSGGTMGILSVLKTNSIKTDRQTPKPHPACSVGGRKPNRITNAQSNCIHMGTVYIHKVPTFYLQSIWYSIAAPTKTHTRRATRVRCLLFFVVDDGS